MYWNDGLVPGKYLPVHLMLVPFLLILYHFLMSYQVKVCLILTVMVGGGFGFGPKSGSTGLTGLTGLGGLGGGVGFGNGPFLGGTGRGAGFGFGGNGFGFGHLVW